MLSPQATGLKKSATPEHTPGYALGSAKNTKASSTPITLCIVERRWGGAIISAAIYSEDQIAHARKWHQCFTLKLSWYLNESGIPSQF